MMLRALFALFVALVATLTGCSAPATSPTAAPPTCSPEPEVRSTVEYAKNFSLRYEDGYQVLTVHQPAPGAPAESYVLVRCGADPQLPPELANAPRINVPIRSLYAGSTTHLPLLVDLDRLDVLTGVATAAFVTSPQVNERIAAGAVTEFAPNQQFDVERVISGHPEVLMTDGFDDPGYGPVRAAGIAVVANAEYLEPTPLGRAEWIKVMAALTGDERQATQVFDEIKSRYNDIAARARQAGQPVPVIAGSMFEGVWSVPAGGSYVGQLLRDAGASTPWQDDPSTGSLTLSFETVYAQAGQAPIWLATQDWRSRADVLAADPRYGELAAMKTGQLWTANKSMGPGGGSDFYERGVMRPDLVLADLVAILHPELAPGHEFTFYTQVQ